MQSSPKIIYDLAFELLIKKSNKAVGLPSSGAPVGAWVAPNWYHHMLWWVFQF